MKRRPNRRHHVATVNIVERVLSRNAALSAAHVAGQMEITRNALRDLPGSVTPGYWKSLVDTANMAETLAAMGLGSGPQADSCIARAQDALGAMADRRQHAASWQPQPDELEALEWLLQLHAIQLRACTYREFEEALSRLERRISQALKGNAKPGTVVVTGDIGASA